MEGGERKGVKREGEGECANLNAGSGRTSLAPQENHLRSLVDSLTTYYSHEQDILNKL